MKTLLKSICLMWLCYSTVIGQNTAPNTTNNPNTRPPSTPPAGQPQMQQPNRPNMPPNGPTGPMNMPPRPGMMSGGGMKMSHIFSRLRLTPDVMQKFMPVYNEYNTKTEELKGQYKKALSSMDPSKTDDKSLAVILDEKAKFSQSEMNLEKEYFQKFKSLLSPQQLLQYYQTDADFSGMPGMRPPMPDSMMNRQRMMPPQRPTAPGVNPAQPAKPADVKKEEKKEEKKKDKKK